MTSDKKNHVSNRKNKKIMENTKNRIHYLFIHSIYFINNSNNNDNKDDNNNNRVNDNKHAKNIIHSFHGKMLEFSGVSL